MPPTPTTPERIQIRNRWTDAVIFECELSAEFLGMSVQFKLGWAVKKAVKARANLADANLAGANLADAYLARANLARANLAGAYLAGAYLADAYLADAYLARANLDGANLADANLAGANLAGAYLAGAYLAGAKIGDDITITRPPLQILGLSYPVLIFDNHIKIGCELHSIAEWQAFDNERIARMDGTRARRFWDRHKTAILCLAASDARGVDTAEVEGV